MKTNFYDIEVSKTQKEIVGILLVEKCSLVGFIVSKKIISSYL